MDSIEKRNSITYDAEKDELKIITYYDERRYKRDMGQGLTNRIP